MTTGDSDSGGSTRPGGRGPGDLRPVRATLDFLKNADASVLFEQGGTRLICTASVQERVPEWLAGKGVGWLTAEYAMLPASTGIRKPRDRAKQDGRGVEIQRLIGRSLRAVIDRTGLGERTVTVDCDVIDADGGTRCAAICGGYIALHTALARLVERGDLERVPLHDSVSAVSVGIVEGAPLVDLEYVEDSRADVDMNLVMTGEGRCIEVQASAEGATYSRDELDTLLELGSTACGQLTAMQQAALGA